MSKLLVSVLSIFFSTICLAQVKPKAAAAPAKTGYSIKATITPYKNCWLYLGCYYGKYRNLVDSAYVNAQSQAEFKGSKKLPGGLYFLVSPTKTILFEILMDDKQQMTVKADSAEVEKAIITGSKDNDLFQTYTKYLGTQVPAMTAAQNNFKQAKTAEDSAKWRSIIIDQNKALTTYRDNIVKANPTSMLAAFFNTIKRPEPPAIPTVNGKPDSAYPFRFVKEHFWDDVDFGDERILRTPFFDPKVDEYFKNYVSPEPDSIIPEVNYMLLASRPANDMFKYLLGKFTDKYVNPEIMGQDKVFIFLFNNFFSKGDTAWLSVKQREFIFNRAYSLMANQLNEPAPTLTLYDTLGKEQSLYSVQAPYTLIAFWDHTCGHCKEQIPRYDSIYKAKWKTLGIKVYSVNSCDKLHDKAGFAKAVNEWSNFLKEKNITDWIQVYQPKNKREEEIANQQAGFKQLYDVYQTPTFYLLDKDKKIIAKRLSLEQFDGLIDAKIKQDKK
ncbi:MAG: DUF5106 domain-containing protein [Bacteroidetes bacterium]|nr:MAG: DUF5106 domain-containing protein [Bacteroidota bacterium]TAE68682.1 MAG: DUF5106 domain-containing protein [Bacteroidota bacterium]